MSTSSRGGGVVRRHTFARLIRTILALALAFLTVPLLTLSSAYAEGEDTSAPTSVSSVESPPDTEPEPAPVPEPDPVVESDPPPPEAEAPPADEEPADDGTAPKKQDATGGEEAGGPADETPAGEPTVDSARVNEAALELAPDCGVTGFSQNTQENSGGDWINGALNANNSNYAEGDFVPQKVDLNGLVPGSYTIGFSFDRTKNGKYAYDYVADLAISGSAGAPAPTWTSTTADFTGPAPVGFAETVFVTIHFTITAGGDPTATITWSGHISSEIDYGFGNSASAISGAPYHFSLVDTAGAFGCDTGNRDNQLMAAAIQFGTIVVIKDALPNSATPFDFDLDALNNLHDDFTLTDDGVGTDNTYTNHVPPGAVTLTETPVAGWNLSDISCTVAGQETATSVTVNVADHTTVTCTFTNSRTASLEVDKLWVINGGTPVAEGSEPAHLGLNATLLLDDVAKDWDTAYTSYLQGAQVEIDENVTFGNALCRWTTAEEGRLTGTGGVNATVPHTVTLGGGANTYTITNRVTCDSQLTLVKDVVNGPALESAWTLSATPTGSGIPFASGASGVTHAVTAATPYILSENAADPRYEQYGAWNCVGTGVTEPTTGQVSVAPGRAATCTVQNATGELILKKTVLNTNGGSAVPGDFTLIADPVTVGSPNLTTPGSAGGTTFFVDPSETFTLSETGVAGYTLSSLVCSNGDTAAGVQVDAGEIVTCTFTNTSQPGTLTLNKVVNSNNTGDTTPATAWLLTAAGVDVANPLISGQGTASGSTKAGTYQLDESGPATHTEGDWDCNIVGGGDAPVSASDQVVVGLGQNVVCTITNTAVQPQLTLDKEVDPGETGDETLPTAFQLTANPVGINGQAPISGAGGVSSVVMIGTYTLSESSVPGYDPHPDGWACVDENNNDAPVAVNAQNQVAVGLGMHVSCVIWNVAIPSEWTVSKSSTPGSGATVLPGQPIDYEVTLTKVGDGVPVEGITVIDTLTGIEDAWVSGLPTQADSPDSYATISNGVITWTVAELGDEPLTLTYRVTVGLDAWNATIDNVVTPGPVGCPDDDPDCNETVHYTPHYTLDKAVAHLATPGDGDDLVEPGEQLEYTLTVTNDTEHAMVDALIEDDLSDILDDATMVTTTQQLADQGATLTGTTLTWLIEDLGPGDTVEATYVVQVKPGAWGATLHNIATPEPDTGGECIPPGDVPGDEPEDTAECETTSTTPPVTTLLVQKVDAETPEVAIAGAGFTLYLDANNTGEGACEFATPPVVEPGDTAVGPQEFTNVAGQVRFEELQEGCYILQESTTPAGFEELDPKPTMGIDLTGNLFIAGGETAPVVFTNVAEGNIQVVAKQQFELIGGSWVPSDGVVDYGDQVKYQVQIAVTGPKKFHDITVTDFVPGHSPEDTQSTLDATLVPGSPVCIGTLACTASVNAETQEVTWDIGDVDPDIGQTLSTTAEMVVNFPELSDDRVPAAGGTVSDALWNVGYLNYGVFTGLPEVLRGGARMAMAAAPDPGVTMFSLRSNEVLVTASLTLPPPAGETQGPGKKSGLPQTGAPAGLLPLGVLGGLLVAGGLALTRRTRKE